VCGGLMRASVATGAKFFNCETGSLVATREDAIYKIEFALLNHRVEAFVSKAALTERLE